MQAPSETVEAVAFVHVAGPVETETVDVGVAPRGFVYVQRCLRCDELLGIWKLANPPRSAFVVGSLVAVDAKRGIRGGRALASLPYGAGIRDCQAV